MSSPCGSGVGCRVPGWWCGTDKGPKGISLKGRFYAECRSPDAGSEYPTPQNRAMEGLIKSTFLA